MRRLLRDCLVVLVLSGCQNQSQPPAQQPVVNAPAASQEPAAPPREYTLVGEVVSVDKAAKKATIKHEKIEGYMPAMTMSYPIPEQEDLDKIKAGDRITATVYDSEADPPYWIGKIQVGEPAAK